jgi:hypothetical protein
MQCASLNCDVFQIFNVCTLCRHERHAVLVSQDRLSVLSLLAAMLRSCLLSLAIEVADSTGGPLGNNGAEVVGGDFK